MESSNEKIVVPFNREEAEVKAMEDARLRLEELGIDTLEGQEKLDKILKLINDLNEAEDNTDRHVAEALCQILTAERAKAELNRVKAQYPLAA